MYIDREQESALNGEKGAARQWAMGVLVELGGRSSSARLLPVSSVHIPSWCGSDRSEAWTALASFLEKPSMPITANPGDVNDTSLDRGALEALRSGISYSYSCAPYLSGNHPGKGRVVAWGGRAATSFANSVLGARCDHETFETAVASAITGLTPERRLHLDAGRKATVAALLPVGVKVDYALLGWELSKVMGNEVPVLCGARPTFDEAKKLALAINSRGTVPLFLMQSSASPPRGIDAVEVKAHEPDASDNPTDLVILGCPHMSEQDINRWAKKLEGRSRSAVEAWFFTSRLCLDKCPIFGAVLRSRGRVHVETCPLALRKELSGKEVACDSPALAECLQGSGIFARYAPDHELLSILVK